MQNQQGYTLHEEAQPLVSFIITYYNLPVQMLFECIDSVLALALQPAEREIIVIDDGSEVSPINGLMQYGDNIIYVRQKNAGVSVARNTALQMAKGKYIQIIDGDDTLQKAPYEHCLNIIRRDPDADMVMFDFTKSQNTAFSSQTYTTSDKMSGATYMNNHSIHGAVCCCLFRQSIRGRLEFSPGIYYGEDEEFTPQLLVRAETVYSTNAQAYYYRQRKTSAVHKIDENCKQKRLNYTSTVIDRLNNMIDHLPHNDRLAMQRRVAQLTMDYIYNIIMLTQSQKELDERLEELHKKGLFPLPDRNYTQKYKWFRKMTNSKTGRFILLHRLPLLKKER